LGLALDHLRSAKQPLCLISKSTYTYAIFAARAMKKDIRLQSSSEIEAFLVQHGEKTYRGRQVQEWLWKKSALSFNEMSNLSVKTRDLLSSHFSINPLILSKIQTSTDGTIKSSFRLFDEHLVEGVLIPVEDRMTACVSSQVGCSLSCKFCATGYMDRIRNLDPGEIYDQVVHIRRQARDRYDTPLTNIVFMGMGEPLLNYGNVISAIDRITSPNGLNMSPRRITVSTAGIAKMIKRLGDDQVKFNLALSLHAANDQKRGTIMPINDSNKLETLAQALNYFYSKTQNLITFEYIVFNDFNDSLDDARELLKFTRKIPGKVNLIEYNPISEAGYTNTTASKLDQFARFLEKNRVNVTVRRSRGKDIDAACGQLANQLAN